MLLVSFESTASVLSDVPINLGPVTLPEKVALVPVKAPPTVNDIPVAVAVAPLNVPPVKGKYGPPITVEAATQVGAALPFDFNICPAVPWLPLNCIAPVE